VADTKARFEGKAVLITGAGSGIGRAAAVAFAREGARVAVVGRRKVLLDETAAAIGERAFAVAADITASGEPARVVAEVARAFGRLDVLVNNAGVFFRKLLSETSDADLASAFGTNVIAPLALAREALPWLRKGPGCVVNVSSTTARISKLTLSAYSASKLGLEQATRSLAVELGPEGIRVNCVAPGMTDTGMIDDIVADPDKLKTYLAATPLARMGRAEDVARSILFLASDDASWVTGQVLQASGGFQL
jgi:NAD(P)-dependent dehydrogenase (short-subunit alcohol dehydrogenase family)